MEERYQDLLAIARRQLRVLWPLVVRLARTHRCPTSADGVVDVSRVLAAWERPAALRKPIGLDGQRISAARTEEAEMRMVAFLATNLVRQLRIEKPPRKWPGGLLRPREDLLAEQQDWVNDTRRYYHRSLRSAGFPEDYVEKLAEGLVRKLPPKRRTAAVMAREITGRFWKLWSGRKKLLAGTVDDYVLAVKLLDRFGKRLEQPDAVLKLGRSILDEVNARRRIGGHNNAVLEWLLLDDPTEDEADDDTPICVSDPADPRWLPRLMLGFEPQLPARGREPISLLKSQGGKHT